MADYEYLVNEALQSMLAMYTENYSPEACRRIAAELLAARKVIEISRVIGSASEQNLTAVRIYEEMKKLDEAFAAYDEATKGE